MRFFKLFTPVYLTSFFFGLYEATTAQTYLNGFGEMIQGEEIAYHAPDPRADRALLVRSQNSNKMIQWNTVEVPENFSEPTISFVWLFGMDADAEQHEFTLSISGRELLTFRNPSVAEKTKINVDGADQSKLQFRITQIDRHRDVMGYAILTLPAGLVIPGEPVSLQVHGESAGSNIWYMTFKYPVVDEIGVGMQQVLVRKGKDNMQAIEVEMINLDDRKNVVIGVSGQAQENYTLETGYNALQYFVKEVEDRTEVDLTIRISGKEVIKKTCTLQPVKHWTVYLVQHTHTDIGYTRPQSEILPEHLRFIDYALDYCDLTDSYPEDAKFRWTCESAWAVEQYLQRRPDEQVNRLLQRIREGRIEVTAMLFNMSEVADETALKNMLQPIHEFHELGIEVKAAMQDDVNGIGWCMADYFPDIGVKYLIMGEHGHRALIPFDMPTSFWWVSPSGKRVLAFRGEHYMHGNALLLHTGDLENFQSGLLNYLEMLEWKEYPYDRIALQYSGYVTDNSPPALTPNKVIREWNEKYIWPKLRSATASEFMEHIENNHSHELEIYQKAWPDWWTDGFGSAARETAAIREAQAQMTVTTGLLSMGWLLGADIDQQIHRDMDQIYRNILFYDEHTFGAAESISDPYAENSMVQWAEKSSYAWEALKQSRIVREEAFGLLQGYLPRHPVPSITVFNTLNKKRSGPVSLYIDHEIIEPGSAFAILDPVGSVVPVQAASSRSDGTYWEIWADDVPPMGYKSLKIHKGGTTVPSAERNAFTGTFENEFWKASIDPANGSVASLYHKVLGKDLIDRTSSWKPGQLIYERLTDRRQLELFTLKEEPARSTLVDVTFNYQEQGPLWTTLSLSGTLEECAQGLVVVEYRFYNSEPVIEIFYDMVKNPVTDPEALYVAFPFKMEDAEIIFEGQGGIVRPGLDQLEGTASDWNTIQNYVSVRSDKDQLVVVSPDVPLFHLGGMNLGKFSYRHVPESIHLYSWVMNNYWTTNFRASQEGALKWRYLITLTEDTGNTFSTDFGWQSHIPLTGRVFPEGREDNKPLDESLVTIGSPDILLVSAVPTSTGKGIVLHLRETSGNTVVLNPYALLSRKGEVICSEVNAIGELLREIPDALEFKPYSVHFVEINRKE